MGTHSLVYRVTTITDLHTRGVPLEDVRAWPDTPILTRPAYVIAASYLYNCGRCPFSLWSGRKN